MSGSVDGEPLTCIYRQYDGYLSGHGAALSNGFGDFTIVNGYSGDDDKRTANGMGCLAAQMLAAFKSGVGGVYVYPSDAPDEEYTYTIYADGSDNGGIATGSLHVKVMCGDAELYHGPLSDLPESEPDEG